MIRTETPEEAAVRHIRGHVVWIALWWILLTVVLEALVAKVPVPSPVGSDEALGEHQTVYLLFYIAVPFFAFIWVMLVYALAKFRAPADETRDAPPVRDSSGIVFAWAAISFATVLFLAGWGTFTLHEITGRDGPGKILHVQVIGQQWFWTYRYPSYGGAESSVLVIPDHRAVEFDVTSIDVVHSFWIYNLDIKEDAVPGVVNRAYVNARFTASSSPSGANWVVCNELCGLYHGYMRSQLRVLAAPAFDQWASALESSERKDGLLHNLPKYKGTYFPPPVFPPTPQDQPT